MIRFAFSRFVCAAVVLAGCAAGNVSGEDAKPDGWVDLFDGKTLNGWKGDLRSLVQGAATPRRDQSGPADRQAGRSA